eukprot:UC4_evm3s1211
MEFGSFQSTHGNISGFSQQQQHQGVIPGGFGNVDAAPTAGQQQQQQAQQPGQSAQFNIVQMHGQQVQQRSFGGGLQDGSFQSQNRNLGSNIQPSFNQFGVPGSTSGQGSNQSQTLQQQSGKTMTPAEMARERQKQRLKDFSNTGKKSSQLTMESIAGSFSLGGSQTKKKSAQPSTPLAPSNDKPSFKPVVTKSWALADDSLSDMFSMSSVKKDPPLASVPAPASNSTNDSNFGSFSKAAFTSSEEVTNEQSSEVNPENLKVNTFGAFNSASVTSDTAKHSSDGDFFKSSFSHPGEFSSFSNPKNGINGQVIEKKNQSQTLVGESGIDATFGSFSKAANKNVDTAGFEGGLTNSSIYSNKVAENPEADRSESDFGSFAHTMTSLPNSVSPSADFGAFAQNDLFSSVPSNATSSNPSLPSTESKDIVSAPCQTENQHHDSKNCASNPNELSFGSFNDAMTTSKDNNLSTDFSAFVQNGPSSLLTTSVSDNILVPSTKSGEIVSAPLQAKYQESDSSKSVNNMNNYIEAPQSSIPEYYLKLHHSVAANVAEDAPIPSQSIFNLFSKSGLDKKTLNTVWTLSTRSTNGKMKKDSFFIALGLIAIAQKGVKVSLENLFSQVLKPLPKFSGFEDHDVDPSDSIDPTRLNVEKLENLKNRLINDERYPEAVECSDHIECLKNLKKGQLDLSVAKADGAMEKIISLNSEIRYFEAALVDTEKVNEWEDNSRRREDTIAQMGLRVLQRKDSQSEKEFYSRFSASAIRQLAIQDLKAAAKMHSDALRWSDNVVEIQNTIEEESCDVHVSVWKQILEACTKLIREGNELTASFSVDSTLARQVADSDRGNIYLKSMIEVYCVSQQIRAGSVFVPGSLELLVDFFSELELEWDIFSSRLRAANINPPQQNTSTFSKDSTNLCSLTLCPLGPQNMSIEDIALPGSSLSPRFIATSAGVKYSVSAANLWKHLIGGELPQLKPQNNNSKSLGEPTDKYSALSNLFA